MFHLPSLAVVVWGLSLVPGKSKPCGNAEAEGRSEMKLLLAYGLW